MFALHVIIGKTGEKQKYCSAFVIAKKLNIEYSDKDSTIILD